MVSVIYNGLLPNWDLLRACTNDHGKYLQIIMTLIVIMIMALFQDIAGILLLSHDSSSLLGRMLFGATFLIFPFYRWRYSDLKQFSDLSEKGDQQLLPCNSC